MKRPTESLSAEIAPCRSGWSFRDSLAAAVLFLATAAVVLWQNGHLAVLWDLSYTLDSSFRIALGQMPYRDFPFAHAPLTFLIQAALLRWTGRVFFHHVLYAAVVGGLGTVLAWRIALHSLRGRVRDAWTISLLLAAPLTVLGIYSILPFPSYDCDTVFFILLAVLLLQHVEQGTVDAVRGKRVRTCLAAFAAGSAMVLPLFAKQNIGLPFLMIGIAAIVLLLVMQRLRRVSEASRCSNAATLWIVLGGIFATLASALLLLQCTAGIGNYYRWTIQFAAERRLPGIGALLSIYRQPSLLWMLPCVVVALILMRSRFGDLFWARILALVLFAAPFLWTIFSLFLYDDVDERGDALLGLWPLLLLLSVALTLLSLRRMVSLRSLMPVIVLAAIHGTLLSQQLWGSTYAIWPLLIFLVAEMIAFLAEYCLQQTSPGYGVSMPLALSVVIAATLLICGGFYMASEERLSYAKIPAETAQHSTSPQLQGMAVPGPYLANFDELLRYADAYIPRTDGVLLLPGEDPFYFATGRVPQFPVLLFDPATDPYSPAQLVELVRRHRIHWLIVKRELQIKEDPTPQREATLYALEKVFTLQDRLQGYDIYRRP